MGNWIVEWGDYDCSEYAVNYTVYTLKNPKSFVKTVPGNRQYLFIKLLRNHALKVGGHPGPASGGWNVPLGGARSR